MRFALALAVLISSAVIASAGDASLYPSRIVDLRPSAEHLFRGASASSLRRPLAPIDRDQADQFRWDLVTVPRRSGTAWRILSPRRLPDAQTFIERSRTIAEGAGGLPWGSQAPPPPEE